MVRETHLRHPDGDSCERCGAEHSLEWTESRTGTAYCSPDCLHAPTPIPEPATGPSGPLADTVRCTDCDTTWGRDELLANGHSGRNGSGRLFELAWVSCPECRTALWNDTNTYSRSGQPVS